MTPTARSRESRRQEGHGLIPAVVMAVTLLVPPGAGAESFGDVVGSFGGVKAYSNYLPPRTRTNHSVTDANGRSVITGLKWECVEYVRRYYLQTYGMDLRSRHMGDAWTFADRANATRMGLVYYTNGGKVPPRVGDILVSDYRTGGAVGHVAIVTAVDAARGTLKVIQQNRLGPGAPVGTGGAASQVSYSDRTQVAGGVARVGAFFDSGKYPVSGWLRRDAAEIVSPAPGSTVYYPVTLSWRGARGTYTNAEEYYLKVGSWANASNFHAGSVGRRTDDSPVAMAYVPPGQRFWVTLWTRVAGAWQANATSYTMGYTNGPQLQIDYQTYSYGRQGSTFTFRGWGFTPFTKVTPVVRNETTAQQHVLGPATADYRGRVEWSYRSNCATLPSTYTIWADGLKGWTMKTTNRVVEHVLVNGGCAGW